MGHHHPSSRFFSTSVQLTSLLGAHIQIRKHWDWIQSVSLNLRPWSIIEPCRCIWNGRALAAGLSIKTAFSTNVASIMHWFVQKKSKPLQTRSSSSQWESAWIRKNSQGEYKSVIVGSLRGGLQFEPASHLPAVPALSYTGPSTPLTSQSILCHSLIQPLHTTKIYSPLYNVESTLH